MTKKQVKIFIKLYWIRILIALIAFLFLTAVGILLVVGLRNFFTLESFRVRNTKSDLRFSIYEQFNKNNITIPFPQQDIYVKEMPGKF